MAHPLLSVVIPTFNRAHLVCDAIDSALEQGSGAVEAIVVDDGSTDGTSSLLAEQFGSQIKVIRLHRNSGISAARNAGVRLATGEFLAFLDSDDIWLPGKLDAELEVFDGLPEAEVVVSDSLTFIEDQQSDRSWFARNGLLKACQGRTCLLDECPWMWGRWENNIATCSIAIRRDILDRFGDPLFAEDLLLGGEDWELAIRIFNQSRVAVLPQVWAHVRRFEDPTRQGRGTPGKSLIPSQKISFLINKLRILERVSKLDNLPEAVALDLKQSCSTTAKELVHYQNIAI